MNKDSNLNNTFSDPANFDWNIWLKRWDKMQEGYLPWREYSYKLMFDAIEYWLPSNFIALDVACGPGSISSRLLSRFPNANCIGVDFDPILLAIGRNTLGSFSGRMRWMQLDIREPDWVNSLPVEHADVILSSTSLHWLAAGELVTLYMQFGNLLHPGGLFLNADEMRPASHEIWPFFRNWSRQAWAKNFSEPGSESWEQFWQAIAETPEFIEYYREHLNLMNTQHCTSDAWGATFPLHLSMLQASGFQDVETLWQDGIERVILAIR
jgi:SAM-dependent methyltransferase